MEIDVTHFPPIIQWIIALVGAAVASAVYAWGRRSQAPAEMTADAKIAELRRDLEIILEALRTSLNVRHEQLQEKIHGLDLEYVSMREQNKTLFSRMNDVEDRLNRAPRRRE